MNIITKTVAADKHTSKGQLNTKSQVKSKKRVSEYGEVFTNPREVNAMLDMVEQETQHIDSTFLDPACGNGNFLIEILRRKLAVVRRLYSRKNSWVNYEKYSILALSSIYGVDIMEDNAAECRKRLFDEWNQAYSKQCGKEANDECREAAKYILERNIICGDTLTMFQNNGNLIVFSQWDFVGGPKVKRRDYRLDQIAMSNGQEPEEENNTWVPAPIAEYPLINYWEVQNDY